MSRTPLVIVVLALLGLSAAVQYVTIRRAVVPAQDAVRYAAAAQAYARDGLWQSLAEEPEPPLFPILASWTQFVLERTQRMFSANHAPAIAWATILQVTAAVPLVLCVVPVYLFTLRWLGSREALVTGILFAVLKEPARLGADGISDSTHLFWVAVALWAASIFLYAARPSHGIAAAGLQRKRTAPGEQIPAKPVWLALCGAAVGMALLVRPESLLLLTVLMALLPIVARDMSPRRPAASAAMLIVMLLLGLSAVLLPYAFFVGVDDPAGFAQRVMGRLPPRDGLTLNDAGSDVAGPPRYVPAAAKADFNGSSESLPAPTLPDGARMRFVLKETNLSSRFDGVPSAVAEYAGELSGAFQYWLVPFALLAVWRARRNWRRPLNLFASTAFVLFSLVVVLYSSRVGYLSGRHLLILLLLGLPWAGRGIVDAGRLLRLQLRRAGQRSNIIGRLPVRLALPALVITTAAACLTSTIGPLHASHAGHRRAAVWLSQPGRASGAVLDSRGWTGLYSGRHTYLCDAGWQAVADPRLAYVVLESWETELSSRRSRTLRHLLQTCTRRVAAFSDATNPLSAEVVVYRIKPPAIERTVSSSEHDPNSLLKKSGATAGLPSSARNPAEKHCWTSQQWHPF